MSSKKKKNSLPRTDFHENRFVGYVVRLLQGVLPEPRWASAIFSLLYTVMLCAGVFTMISPPGTLSNVVGDVAMITAGGCWVVGSLVGMLTGAKEWWEMERWAIAVMLLGNVFYGGIQVYLQIAQPGMRIPVLSMIIGTALFLVFRFGLIWRYPFKHRS